MRTRLAAALIGCALVLTGCAPSEPEIIQDIVSSSEKEYLDALAAMGEVRKSDPMNPFVAEDREAVHGEDRLYLVMHGSSSCPPMVEEVDVDVKRGEVAHAELRLNRYDGACTSDYGAHFYEILLADGYTVSPYVVVTVKDPYDQDASPKEIPVVLPPGEG